MTLAIFGGTPVRQKTWPTWPQANEKAKEYLSDVLNSGRWGIGGKYDGTPLFDIRFAEAFANFNSSNYCVTTSSGSAALVIAMQALDIGFGDEVIVPGLSWISCATAITRIGAVPILVDIDPETLCLSLNTIQLAINQRTKGIIVVHSYCTVADVDKLVALSTKVGVPLIEDCSQAHGAKWKGRRVGTFGKIGVFSMGNSKVLSCGEGGAAITDDPKLYDIMQQLRGDGYRYKNGSPKIGESQLEEIGAVQGHNYCLTEFQSAILLSGLEDLDQLNNRREENGEYLRKLSLENSDWSLLFRHPNIDQLTYFRVCIRFNLSAFGEATIDQIRKALTFELNETTLEPVDHPLNNYSLYKPLQSPMAQASLAERKRLDPARFQLPSSEKAYKECLTFHHAMLLGGKRDIEDIVEGIIKLKRYHKELANVH